MKIESYHVKINLSKMQEEHLQGTEIGPVCQKHRGLGREELEMYSESMRWGALKVS